MTDPAQLAHDAIVRRLCYDSGLDGYAADLIVADAGERGTASPYFSTVRPAAQAVYDAVARPIADVSRLILDRYAALAVEVGRAMTRLFEQYRPAVEAAARFAHDYDKAQRPRRHARECPTCREATT